MFRNSPNGLHLLAHLVADVLGGHALRRVLQPYPAVVIQRVGGRGAQAPRLELRLGNADGIPSGVEAVAEHVLGQGLPASLSWPSRIQTSRACVARVCGTSRLWTVWTPRYVNPLRKS